MTSSTAIIKQDGMTKAERYLSVLCERSFLSLWSYPGIYRDQGKAENGDGKEICDLLVVFDNDLIIFSDKDCRFGCTGKIDLDWTRWFRRAVQKSAQQLWGAERWIRENPSRIFVDRRCQQHLPVPLPDTSEMRIHRVLVAHDVARCCKELVGGSGSLVILPYLSGSAHFSGPVDIPIFGRKIYDTWSSSLRDSAGYTKTVLPFAIGDLDANRGFVHVFDDTGLAAVMSELDTPTDFVTYLSKREKYIRGGRLMMAPGEDDLLAHYLQQVTEAGEFAFYRPADLETTVIIPEGEWQLLQEDQSWREYKQAGQVSYLWDKVIEKFNKHILDGTSEAYPFADFKRQELAVRAMARENRFNRRALANALKDFLENRRPFPIAARLVKPVRQLGTYYVYLTVRPEQGEDYQHYRKRRSSIGYAYLIETRRKFSDAKESVVLATEPLDWAKWTTEDLHYRGDQPLTAEEIESVREYVADQGILAKLGEPIEVFSRQFHPPRGWEIHPNDRKANPPSSIRNSPCPCGSGIKFKKCCIKKHSDLQNPER